LQHRYRGQRRWQAPAPWKYEGTAFPGAEHRGRVSGVRYDHLSRRPSRCPTGAEVPVL